MPTFRLFTGVQLVMTALGVVVQQFGLFEPRPRSITLSLWNLVEPGLLFLYLSLPVLRKWLKASFLPIGIGWAAVGLLLEPYLTGNYPHDSFVTWLWRQTLFLCIPVYVISWRYSMRQVVLFAALTAVSNVALLSQLFTIQDLMSGSLLVIVSLQVVLFLVIGYVIVKMMHVQREHWQRLTEANARLAQHATTLEQLTISRERNRLARELHDVLAHTLSGVAVELEGLRATMHRDPEQANALLNHSLQAIRDGLTETRRALQELRAQPLEDLGLALAVQTLAESSATRSDFRLELDIDDDLGDYPEQVQQSVYRIAQEALANVTDHAQAHNVQVILRRDRHQIRLVVRDDGCGFDPDRRADQDHYGLLGMRERAETVGGSLAVESQLGKGTQVSFTYGGNP